MHDDATTVQIRAENLHPAAIAASAMSPSVPVGETGAQPRALHSRLLHGMRHPHNWLQLIRFGVVGASGYAVNLALFAALDKGLRVEYLLAETVAWVVAAANNFWWNRHWTFKAGDGMVRTQAFRFFVVSLVALGFNLVVLRVLVKHAGVDELVAEVVALVASTPPNFLGNKLWSFKADIYTDGSPPQEN
jgi:putative flippase GtrA